MWLIHTSLMQQPQWIQTLQHLGLCGSSTPHSCSSRSGYRHCNTWAYVAHPHLTHAAAAMDTDIATLGLMWLIHTSLMQQPQWIQTSATLFQSCGDGAVDCTNLVDTVSQAEEECAINGSWSSILLVFAPSSALSEPIVSVFPKITHYARSLYHGVIQPQSTSQHLKVSEFRPLIISWSQYGNASIATDSLYKPNHVVPLVASEAGEQDRHVNEIEQNADDHPSTSVGRPKTKVKSKRAGKTK